MQTEVQSFDHAVSGTWTHIAYSPRTRVAAIIDPVLDFEYRSGRTSHQFSRTIAEWCEDRQLDVQWILETHAHADHISDAPYLQARLAAPIGIGQQITRVQAHFKSLFNLPADFTADGSQFDRLFKEADSFQIGDLTGQVIATPGHTPDSSSYLIGDALFVGDSLLAPDFGTARCDFPGGDAGVLYDSIEKLYGLPEQTRVYLCHDYPPDHRPAWCETSIGVQRSENIHVRADTRRDDFIRMRRQRDSRLPVPELLFPAVQLNINAGRPLPPESNGVSYIKVPLNALPDGSSSLLEEK